jgi:hypothetical protein
MAEGKNRFIAILTNPKNPSPGNIFALQGAGTKLNNTYGVFGILDHAHRMAPAIVGGLLAKSIYNWGVRVFKKADDKKFWQVANTDEGAGSLMLWLITYLLMKFLPGHTTERLCCGLIGRGSIVVFNTLARWMGKNDWVRANETTDAGMVDAIDITPRVLAAEQMQREGEPANAAPSGPELDQELMREVGGLALKSAEFRNQVSDGLARRLNDYLADQGRKSIEPEEVHSRVVDLFQAMANR